MAKNNYKMNVNQYANQEESIRKAKGNPNKNVHHKKKNSNYGGSATGAYMAQKVVEKVNKQHLCFFLFCFACRCKFCNDKGRLWWNHCFVCFGNRTEYS